MEEAWMGAHRGRRVLDGDAPAAQQAHNVGQGGAGLDDLAAHYVVHILVLAAHHVGQHTDGHLLDFRAAAAQAGQQRRQAPCIHKILQQVRLLHRDAVGNRQG